MSQSIEQPPQTIASTLDVEVDSDEEQDEFVVIQEPCPQPPAINDIQQVDPPMHYVQKSAPVSECGPEVADVGEGLDCGREENASVVKPALTMSSSMISGRSQNILDSMYMSMYGAPSVDNSQVEKLVEVFKGESEKNRNVLDQIFTMIADLHKEKNSNSELRNQLDTTQQQLKGTQTQLSAQMEVSRIQQEVEKKFGYQNSEYQTLLDKITRLSLALADKDTQMDYLGAEMLELKNKNKQLKEALEEAQQELNHKSSEAANQCEIINVLQEENIETNKELLANKKNIELDWTIWKL
uniref:Uncharacterized protein n=1 Tax=Ditylenchus dipsaci TaxID=166011 RepID=A0A915DKH3_9BILA